LAGYILSRTILKEQSIIGDEEEAMMLDEETKTKSSLDRILFACTL